MRLALLLLSGLFLWIAINYIVLSYAQREIEEDEENDVQTTNWKWQRYGSLVGILLIILGDYLVVYY